MKHTLKISIALMLAAATATAQLTVSVTPGYRFNSGENVTLSKLNQLGAPMVSVAGTVTGSSLAAGGVGSVHIHTNATDQATILGGYDGTSDTDLRVRYDTNTLNVNALGLGVKTNSLRGSNFITAATITATEMAPNSVTTNAIGTNRLHLSQLPGGITNKLLYADTNGAWQLLTVGTGLEITNNTIQLTNTTSFTSGEFAIATGRTSTNHALGRMPTFIRWVMVCKTNDAGYIEGEELAVASFEDAAAQSTPQFAWGANSTNVFIVASDADLTVANGSTGLANTAITEVRWRLKCYAQ
jgi:hypothetical protein